MSTLLCLLPRAHLPDCHVMPQTHYGRLPMNRQQSWHKISLCSWAYRLGLSLLFSRLEFIVKELQPYSNKHGYFLQYITGQSLVVVKLNRDHLFPSLAWQHPRDVTRCHCHLPSARLLCNAMNCYKLSQTHYGRLLMNRQQSWQKISLCSWTYRLGLSLLFSRLEFLKKELPYTCHYNPLLIRKRS